MSSCLSFDVIISLFYNVLTTLAATAERIASDFGGQLERLSKDLIRQFIQLMLQ